jgi:AcrR family transcriptional regulator
MPRDESSYNLPPALTKRSQQKRALILSAAMRYFAQHGYEAARVGDIAAELGIAKGSVFQHFISKDGLFLEAYKESLRALPGYMDCPEEVKSKGFFAILRHRLTHAGQLRDQHEIQYQVMLLGNYGSDLALKKRIGRFIKEEDPLGLKALIKLGIERDEVRRDVDPELIESIIECTVERFQDSLNMAESHPELFHRATNGYAKGRQERIEEFMLVLRGAVGTAKPTPAD